MILYHHLKADVKLVKFSGNTLEVNISDSAPNNLSAQLVVKLQEFTGCKWLIISSQEKGAETSYEQEKKNSLDELEKLKEHAMVKDVLNTFTDLQILDIKTIN